LKKLRNFSLTLFLIRNIQGNFFSQIRMNNGKQKLALAILIVLLILPSYSLAFVEEGEECGLVVETADDYVDVTNLNPGDLKSSYLIVNNENDNPFQYYMNMSMIDRTEGVYPGLDGKSLDEVLQITLHADAENEVNGEPIELFQGLITEFEDEYGEEGMDLGTLAGNDSQKIIVSIYLPGEETDNHYQGASVTINYSFRAICNGIVIPPGPPGVDPNDNDENNNDIHEEIDPEDPEVEPDILEEEQAIEEDEETILPATWEMPPYLFYILGGLLIGGGLLLGKNANNTRIKKNRKK